MKKTPLRRVSRTEEETKQLFNRYPEEERRAYLNGWIEGRERQFVADKITVRRLEVKP